MTTDDKYSRRNMLNFTQQLEAPLSQKQDLFLIFYCISEMCIKFRAFGKKDEYPSRDLPGINEFGEGGYLNV